MNYDKRLKGFTIFFVGIFLMLSWIANFSLEGCLNMVILGYGFGSLLCSMSVGELDYIIREIRTSDIKRKRNKEKKQ